MVGRRLKPVLHLEDWLAPAGVANGWLFRRISNDGKTVTGDPISDRAVVRVVQRRVAAAGLNPTLFGGHSLRAGFLTAAARSGASMFEMQVQSRHKSIQVLSGYVRSEKLFEDHAGQRVAWTWRADAVGPTPSGVRRCGRSSGVQAPPCG